MNDFQVDSSRKLYVSKIPMKTCEICADEVTDTIFATECGHMIWLCETCKVKCPAALRVCLKCEDEGK